MRESRLLLTIFTLSTRLHSKSIPPSIGLVILLCSLALPAQTIADSPNIYRNPNKSGVVFLKPNSPRRRSKSDLTSKTFHLSNRFEAHKSTFQRRSLKNARKLITAQSKQLGVTSRKAALMDESVYADQLGMFHVHYQQKGEVSDGNNRTSVPIFGTSLDTHHNPDGELVYASAQLTPEKELSAQITLTSQDAKDLAMHSFLSKYPVTTAPLVDEPKLYFFNLGLIKGGLSTSSRLAWAVKVSAASAPQVETIFIDARSGEQLYEMNHARALNRKVYDCSAASVYSGNCQMDRRLSSRHGGGILGRSENQPERGPNTLTIPEAVKFNGSLDTDHVYDYMSELDDYYRSVFDRRGGNDRGGLGDGSEVPWSESRAYTFYEALEEPDYECYGNAWYNGQSLTFCHTAVVPDIVAHEYSHAVGVYMRFVDREPISIVYEGEGAALDENHSDVLGEAFEHYQKGSNDWIIGSDEVNGGAYRSLADPPSVPPLLPEDPVFVDRFYHPERDCNPDFPHYLAAIIGKGSYLASEGGDFNGCQIEGIGIEKVAQIWQRAMTVYFQPVTTYSDGYQHLLSACADLYSEADCQNVEDALKAIELDQPGPCVGVPRVTPSCSNPSDPDDDEDGISNSRDNCINDHNPEQQDADADGMGDACDSCVLDPGKTSPGICGCGMTDQDSDDNGILDCIESCGSCVDQEGSPVSGICGDVDGDGVFTPLDCYMPGTTELIPGKCGDSNFDGRFTSSDFVTVFQSGLYETSLPATMVQGDWNCDGYFSSSDMVFAFQIGEYEG